MDSEWVNTPLGQLAQFLVDNEETPMTWIGQVIGKPRWQVSRWLTECVNPGLPTQVDENNIKLTALVHALRGFNGSAFYKSQLRDNYHERLQILQAGVTDHG